MRHDARLRRLEARWAPPYPPYEVINALQQAVRAKIARRLDGIADTPEQAAELDALLDQWRVLSQAHPSDARARITEELDRMGARMDRHPTGIWEAQ